MLRSTPGHPITDRDVLEWQRERDAKKEDFPFIQLRRTELRLLKKSEKDWVIITDKEKYPALRLRDLDLVYINLMEKDQKTEVCEIRDRGRNYLMYLRGVKSQKRVESIRYWITTGIAVAALILSLAALLWQAYTWNYELHREDDASFSSCNPDDSPSAGALQEPPGSQQAPHSKSTG